MLRKPGIVLLLLMTGWCIVFAEMPELPKMPAGFEVNHLAALLRSPEVLTFPQITPTA